MTAPACVPGGAVSMCTNSSSTRPTASTSSAPSSSPSARNASRSRRPAAARSVIQRWDQFSPRRVHHHVAITTRRRTRTIEARPTSNETEPTLSLCASPLGKWRDALEVLDIRADFGFYAKVTDDECIDISGREEAGPKTVWESSSMRAVASTASTSTGRPRVPSSRASAVHGAACYGLADSVGLAVELEQEKGGPRRLLSLQVDKHRQRTRGRVLRQFANADDTRPIPDMIPDRSQRHPADWPPRVASPSRFSVLDMAKDSPWEMRAIANLSALDW